MRRGDQAEVVVSSSTMMEMLGHPPQPIVSTAVGRTIKDEQ